MEITSRKNPLIKDYRELNSAHSRSRLHEYFPCEGEKLVFEALNSGVQLGKNAFVTPAAAVKYPDTVKKLSEKCTIITISDDIAGYISDTKSPQGIFVTVKRLDKSFDLSTIYNSTRFILLDGLQDIGNVGTVIRTCNSFAVDGVILSENSADIFTSKGARSTMGAIFGFPIYYSDICASIKLLIENGFTVYAAMLDQNSDKLGQVSFSGKTAVVIGNEGNGISDDVRRLCKSTLYIPMARGESLNAAVAASLIAWEMTKS